MEEEMSSPKAWDLLDDLRTSLQNFDPTTPEEQVVYEQGFERMRDLADARRDRLLEAKQGLPAILWVVLVTGGSSW
jgi:predicted outer membrane protein